MSPQPPLFTVVPPFENQKFVTLAGGKFLSTLLGTGTQGQSNLVGI